MGPAPSRWQRFKCWWGFHSLMEFTVERGLFCVHCPYETDY